MLEFVDGAANFSFVQSYRPSTLPQESHFIVVPYSVDAVSHWSAPISAGIVSGHVSYILEAINQQDLKNKE